MLYVHYLFAFLIGALIGSFLNVVIYRGPDVWGLVTNDSTQKLSLAFPRSHCPNCQTPIKAIDLIPIASFFALKGKCRFCEAPISPLYPWVEFITALSAVFTLSAFGLTPPGVVTFLILCFLIPLTVIDHKTGFLPDALTLPLIALTVGANFFELFIDRESALIGAGIGFLIFWLIGEVFYRIRKVDGLGLGDAKLLAALGGWLGSQALPFIVLISALLGLLVIGISQAKGNKVANDTAIPFGPYLCLSAIIIFALVQSGIFSLTP